MQQCGKQTFDDPIDYVKWCVASGNTHAFYVWRVWRKVRDQVWEMDRRECQYCKAKGVYSRATLVHHVNHLRRRPDLALSIWYTDSAGVERRQLMSCCDACHEEQHPERLRKTKVVQSLTAERW